MTVDSGNYQLRLLQPAINMLSPLTCSFFNFDLNTIVLASSTSQEDADELNDADIVDEVNAKCLLKSAFIPESFNGERFLKVDGRVNYFVCYDCPQCNLVFCYVSFFLSHIDYSHSV